MGDGQGQRLGLDHVLAPCCCATNYPKFSGRERQSETDAERESSGEHRVRMATKEGSLSQHEKGRRPMTCVPGGGGSLGPSWGQPTLLTQFAREDRAPDGNKAGPGLCVGRTICWGVSS